MKPKILIFIDWYLPGYKAGGPITSIANVVSHLNKDYDFYVLTRNTDYGEKVPYSGIEANTWIKKEEYLHVCYISGRSLNRKIVEQKVLEADCSVWYVTGMYSYYFSILPVNIAKSMGNIKVVIAPRGMLSRHALNVKGLKKRFFLGMARMRKMYDNAHFQATSEEERVDVQRFFPNNMVSVAPNLPKPIRFHPIKSRAKMRDELHLVSIARIAKEKNTLFAVEVLLEWTKSKFFSENYFVQFDLYGQRYDNAYWNKCLGVIDQLPMNVIVNYKGTIEPDMIAEVLAENQILFLPTNGENYGHSILEALANERPVLISDRTPWRDLRERNVGWDIPLDDKEEYVKVIQAFLHMNQSDYARMCSSALKYAQEVINDKGPLEAHKRIFTA